MMAKAAAQAVRGRPRGVRATDPGSVDEQPSRIYLYPARLFASARPYYVTTILGSCVAVCLWDPGCRLGGINHFLLPYQATSSSPSFRFGNVAIQRLIDELLGLGSAEQDIQAKLFGGACLVGARQADDRSLGGQNVDLARTLIDQHGIPVVAEDVGGNRGRKLIFCTTTGEAWVKPI
jgi:chemotaxis protein CheD